MELPLYIQFFSEKIGRPISAFTKKDWQQAAMGAAQIVDNLWDTIHPPPKRLGRPPKPRTLSDLLRTPPKKAKRGAPKKEYYGQSPTLINTIIEKTRSPEARKKWPDATRTESKVLALYLRLQSEKHGAVKHDIRSVARAIRRVKKKRTNIKIKSRGI